MNEPGLEAPPEPPEIGKNVFFQWHLDKECLEISCSRWNIVIDQISLDFAKVIAEAMHTNLLEMQRPYIHPSVAPVTIHERRGVLIWIQRYPRYSGEITKDISVRWEENGEFMEISGSGVDVCFGLIDPDFAENLAYAMRLGLPHTESYTAPGSGPEIVLRTLNARIRLWDYPKRTTPP